MLHRICKAHVTFIALPPHSILTYYLLYSSLFFSILLFSILLYSYLFLSIGVTERYRALHPALHRRYSFRYKIVTLIKNRAQSEKTYPFLVFPCSGKKNIFITRFFYTHARSENSPTFFFARGGRDVYRLFFLVLGGRGRKRGRFLSLLAL